jgi:hypothetical protein
MSISWHKISYEEGAKSQELTELLTEPCERVANHRPKNFREIDANEFAQSKFFSYTPSYIGYEQFEWNGEWLMGHMYVFYDNTGIFITSDSRAERNANGRTGYRYYPRYFKFGACIHTHRELSQQEARSRDIPHYGRCYHVNECTKCGFIESYDSSD